MRVSWAGETHGAGGGQQHKLHQVSGAFARSGNQNNLLTAILERYRVQVTKVNLPCGTAHLSRFIGKARQGTDHSLLVVRLAGERAERRALARRDREPDLRVPVRGDGGGGRPGGIRPLRR